MTRDIVLVITFANILILTILTGGSPLYLSTIQSLNVAGANHFMSLINLVSGFWAPYFLLFQVFIVCTPIITRAQTTDPEAVAVIQFAFQLVTHADQLYDSYKQTKKNLILNSCFFFFFY